MNHDELIDQVYRKIERERVIINAANAMRQSSNPQVQQSLDSQVREAKKGISYLEQKMRELQMLKAGQSSQSSGSQRPLPPPMVVYLHSTERCAMLSSKDSQSRLLKGQSQVIPARAVIMAILTPVATWTTCPGVTARCLQELLSVLRHQVQVSPSRDPITANSVSS